MSSEILFELLSGTLNADPNVRMASETRLKEAENQVGFIDSALSIVALKDQLPVQQAAAIYLKNNVSRRWSPSRAQHTLPDQEKRHFRERLIPILVMSEDRLQAQMLAILNTILSYDYPTEWPEFLQATAQLLSAENIADIRAGLVCLLELCKVYRWRSGEKRAPLDTIIAATFSQLLSVAQKLSSEDSDEAAMMLRLCLKCYRSAIDLELSSLLQQNDSIMPWGTLLLGVVTKPVPPGLLPEDPEDRKLCPWWRSKKWAFHCLNRLYVRYGEPSNMLSESARAYLSFARNFITNFAPEILHAYMSLLGDWLAGRVWISDRCLYYIATFFEECVKPKETWKHLKGNIEVIISQFVFPLLCVTDQDIELWEDQPQEYIHKKIDIYDDFQSADVAASNLLLVLASKRQKYSLMPILGFINSVLTRFQQAPQSQKNYKEKEGALRMIGCISVVVMNSKSGVAGQMEGFFLVHVLPEFVSPVGYLRARACEFLNRFAEINFKDPNTALGAYSHILRALEDPDLPVRVEAALALQPLIQSETLRGSMSKDVPHIMQYLLKIANEVDVDMLANVMEEFVENFSVELTPFAAQLATQLRDTFLRIMRDSEAENQASTNTDEAGLFDEKSAAALSVLTTIGTLVLSLDASPKVLSELEEILLPIIVYVLKTHSIDMYTEVFEIIDSLTYCAKSISPVMWQVFELLNNALRDTAIDFVDDATPSLLNYVAFAKDGLFDPVYRLESLLETTKLIFTNDQSASSGKISGCKIFESLLLHYPGKLDAYLKFMVEIPTQILVAADSPQSTVLRVFLVEVVLNAFYYNASSTLQILDSANVTQAFFVTWFHNMNRLQRVHDKKISIVSIASLLRLPDSQLPMSVKQGQQHLIEGLLSLLATLPAALKRMTSISLYLALIHAEREEVKNAEEDDYGSLFENGAFSDSDVEEEVDDLDGDTAQEAAAAGDQDQQYLEFLNKESARIEAKNNILDGVDDDDDAEALDEDPSFETPLDSVNAFHVFYQLINCTLSDPFQADILDLQNNDSQKLLSLTSPLNGSQQQIFQGAFTKGQYSVDQQSS